MDEGPKPQASSPKPESSPAEAPVGSVPQTSNLEPQTAAVAQTPSEPQLTAARPSAPPILIGERQGVGVLMSGSLGLLVLSLLLSVFLPSMQQPGNGIRSSNHPFSSAALAGRDVYASQGCATCHTQLVRNVVADVGLGPVTLDDTNQIIGQRRIGPDLSAIGARIDDTAALMALLAGAGNHPAATGLSEADLANLVAYLRESQ